MNIHFYYYKFLQKQEEALLRVFCGIMYA